MTGKRLPKLKPALWDGAVALCVLALASGIWFGRWRGGASGPLTAVVSADGVEVARVDLSRTDGTDVAEFSANGYVLRVSFAPDGAQVVCADCPTQDCVHTGKATKSGQSIVCLPARIVIRLEGGVPDADAPDAVLG